MASSATVGILRILLTLDSAEYETAMKRASASAKAWERDLKQIGRNATDLGLALTKTLTVPLVAVGAGALKAATDFESSFAGIRKTVDGTVDSMGKLTAAGQAISDGMRALAKEIPISVNELNAIGETAGAMNIAKENLIDFTRVMALLGVTTNLTSQQAARGVGEIQSIFGAGGKDVDRFGATLVALGNAGVSTERDILEMGVRIAGVGNQVGLTQAQVLGFASALSSVGIEAEAGGTSISRAFFKMNDAAMEGGKALEEFSRVAGMSVTDFKALFERDAAEAMLRFMEGLKRVKGEGENLAKTLDGLELGEIRVRDALLRASGAATMFREQIALGSRAWQENTALTKEAEQRFATFESHLTMVWNRVKDVGIEIGMALIPSLHDLLNELEPLIGAVASLARGFSYLPQPVQLAAVGLVALVAAAGPAIWAMGQLAIAASAVVGAFTAKGVATRAINVLFPLLTSATTTVTTAIVGMGTAARATSVSVGVLQFAMAGIVGIAIAGAIWGISEALRSLDRQIAEMDKRFDTMAKASKLAEREIKDYAEAVKIVEAYNIGATKGVLKLTDAQGRNVDVTVDQLKAWQKGKESAEGLSKGVGGIKINVDQAAASLERGTRATRGQAAATQTLSERLADTTRKVAALEEAQKREILAGDKLGWTTKQIADETKIAEDVVKMYSIRSRPPRRRTTRPRPRR